MFAFLVIDGFAIYFAQEIAMYFPMFWIKIISGCLFLLFGVFGLLAKEKDEEEGTKEKSAVLRKFKSPFFSMFFLIFFAEFGDKSQIAAGIFASIYNPIFVFMGVFLALATLTALAMYLGTILFKKIKKDLLEKSANITFIILGAFALFSLLL